MIETIGLIASILVVVSSLSKTTTFKGTLWFRIMNLLGSIFFVIYGFAVNAHATAICNICLFLVNIYYLIKEIADYRKNSCIDK